MKFYLLSYIKMMNFELEFTQNLTFEITNTDFYCLC